MFPDNPPPVPCPPLFAPLTQEAAGHLAEYGHLLKRVMPLTPRHARTLHYEVRDLSASLTEERGEVFIPDYMTRPGPLAAYLHYFHPWNLVRLTRLFADLPLALPDNALVVDLGAGPLTVLQALWLARPELRRQKLRFVCLDRAGKSLRLGRDLFRLLDPESPWDIRLEAEHLFKLPRARADLITAANVLNELSGGPGSRREPDLAGLAGRLAAHLAPDGSLLLVEPGTRLAARRLIELREILIEDERFVMASPCPHQTQCPMPGTGRKAWCHFGFDSQGAPAWLTHLSEAARLPKSRLHVSFVLAGRTLPRPDETQARVVSEAFPLPGGERGQYACSVRGLTLLMGWMRQSGELVRPVWPEADVVDKVSGALRVPMPGPDGKPHRGPQARHAKDAGDGRAAPGKVSGERKPRDERRPRGEKKIHDAKEQDRIARPGLPDKKPKAPAKREPGGKARAKAPGPRGSGRSR